MNDLSLYLLDIAQNSIAAKADIIEITIVEDFDGNRLELTIKDNGTGMSDEVIQLVTNPFYTTRTTRRVGLGIPFLKMAANLANGDLEISSELGKGTIIKTWFELNNVNTPPLGDITETLFILMIHPEIKDLKYVHRYQMDTFEFSSSTIKDILDGVPFTEPSVMTYLKSYLNDNIKKLRRLL